MARNVGVARIKTIIEERVANWVGQILKLSILVINHCEVP